MKHRSEKLTHSEVLQILTDNLRDLNDVAISDRNIPNLINRGKASAAIVTAFHREELMEMKREGSLISIKSAEKPTLKKLKQV
jgi:hypothetical protein